VNIASSVSSSDDEVRPSSLLSSMRVYEVVLGVILTNVERRIEEK
jgi:hypothetical protein